MSDVKTKEAQYEAEYRKLNGPMLTIEFHHIRNNHKKENMMEDLVRMSALMKVMKEKNVPVPGENNNGRRAAAGNSRSRVASNSQSANSYGATAGSNVNWGKVVLGTLIMMVGIGLTVGNTGAIFYGAIAVGFFMMIGGFMGG